MGGGASDPDLGSYRILFELAAGGMGAVQLAHHGGAAGFERLVVVKRLHPHLAKSRELADMFLDEARLAAQIRHPHVVPVDDVVDSGGAIFLVQPYIESVTLAALLDAARALGERIAPELTVRVLLDTLAGLDGAHHATDLRGEPLEIVHRDVSPHNILVGVDGRSRVIDFGIAKAARRITVTQSGTLKGKIPYMAPEQLRRQPVDARADVYSAGVVLYEALTGERPFDGEDEGDTLLSVLLGDPVPPSVLVPGLPAALDDVVAKALAPSRADRFASATELGEALERALAPTTPREVARAVERLAAAQLAALRERVRAALDAEPASAAPASEALAAPITALASDGSRARPRPRRVAATLAAAALAAAALAIALWVRPRADLAEAQAAATVAPIAPAPPAPTASASAAAIATGAAAPLSGSASAAPSIVRAGPPPRRPAGSAKASELHPNPYADHR